MLILILLLLSIVMIIHGFLTLIHSILYKIKINRLLENINSKEDLMFMSMKCFWGVVNEVFKRKGYDTEFTDKCGEEENGLILNETQYVEMWKHSLTQLVEIESAMKLANCMRRNSIYRGMLITLGDYKLNTKSFCHRNVIECINGDQLLEMCKEVQRRVGVFETN